VKKLNRIDRTMIPVCTKCAGFHSVHCMKCSFRYLAVKIMLETKKEDKTNIAKTM